MSAKGNRNRSPALPRKPCERPMADDEKPDEILASLAAMHNKIEQVLGLLSDSRCQNGDKMDIMPKQNNCAQNQGLPPAQVELRERLEEILAKIDSLAALVSRQCGNQENFDKAFAALEAQLGGVGEKLNLLTENALVEKIEALSKAAETFTSNFQEGSHALLESLVSFGREGAPGDTRLARPLTELGEKVDQLLATLTQIGANSRERFENFAKTVTAGFEFQADEMEKIARKSENALAALGETVETSIKEVGGDLSGLQESLSRIGANSRERFETFAQIVKNGFEKIESALVQLNGQNGLESETSLYSAGPQNTENDLAKSAGRLNLREQLSFLQKSLNEERERVKKLENELESRTRELDHERDRHTITLLEKDEALKQGNLERKGQEKADTSEIPAPENEARFSGAPERSALRSELAQYAPLREAMLDSPSFAAVAAAHGIDAEGDLGLFACARSLGESQEFLLEIYEQAKKSRETERPLQPMREDEKRVYKELNQCYRKIWAIDFDVFQQPGGQSIEAEFQPTDFVKDDTIVMENPRDIDRLYTQAVYVPKLLTKAGGKYRSALVRAGNEK